MLGIVLRFILSAVVLWFVGLIVPGFYVAGFLGALAGAIVISILSAIIEGIFGKKVSPHRRGFTGFIVAAIVLYATQFIVPSIRISIVGALIASFVIGLIDAVVPTNLR